MAAGDHDGAIAGLRESSLPLIEAATDRGVVFMFPGQGAQYPGMAAGLYESEPVVRAAVDYCAEVLEPLMHRDLRGLLFPAARRKREAAETLRDTCWAQPALFTVEYALSELLRSWGIQPAAMIGHSIGEFVCAVLAGVIAGAGLPAGGFNYVPGPGPVVGDGASPLAAFATPRCQA